MSISTDFRPLRSVLYMPSSNERALEKAKAIPADALILDLDQDACGAGWLIACELMRISFPWIMGMTANGDDAAVGLGLLGVTNEIAKQAADLGGVDGERGEIRDDLQAILNARGAAVMLEELLDEFSGLGGPFDGRSTACEGEQLLDKALGPGNERSAKAEALREALRADQTPPTAP